MICPSNDIADGARDIESSVVVPLSVASLLSVALLIDLLLIMEN